MTDNKYKMFSLSMLTLIIASIVFTSIPILEGIIDPWYEDGTYSHGFLLLAVTLYLFYRNKKYLQYPTEKVNGLAIGAFFIGYGVWLASIIAGIEVAYRFILPFLLANIFFIVLQPKAAVKFIFPSLFILFAIPFWGLLSMLLQHISAQMVTVIVESYGLSVLLEGTFITIQAGTFEVAGGCSGIRYLLVTLTMASLYSYLYLKTTSSMIRIVLFSILVALVTNWVRIVILVLIGHYSDMQHEMLADHNNLGWIVFCFFLVPMHYYVNRLEKNEAAIKVEPYTINYEKHNNKGSAVISILAVAFVIASSMTYLSNHEGDASSANNFKDSLSKIESNWVKTDIEGGFKPEYVDAESSSVVFKNNVTQDHIQISMYRYMNKVNIADLTDFRNKPIPMGWSVEESDVVILSLSSGDTSAIVSQLRSRRNRAVTLRVNKIGKDFTISNLKSKLFKLSAIKDNERYSGAIILSMVCKRMCNEEIKVLTDFGNEKMKGLSRFISIN